jgi:hypothetical protein
MPVFRGSGTVLSRGDAASPEVFTGVGDVVSIAGPAITKDEIEVTALDSAAKEFIGALDDPGEITMELNWNPQDSEHVNLRTDAEGSVVRNYRVIWSDVSGTTVTFAAEVMEFTLNTEANDAVKASTRMKISGSLIWT